MYIHYVLCRQCQKGRVALELPDFVGLDGQLLDPLEKEVQGLCGECRMVNKFLVRRNDEGVIEGVGVG